MKVYIVKDVGWEWSIDIGVFLNQKDAIQCKETLEEFGVVNTKLGKMKKFMSNDVINIVELEVEL